MVVWENNNQIVKQNFKSKALIWNTRKWYHISIFKNQNYYASKNQPDNLLEIKQINGMKT